MVRLILASSLIFVASVAVAGEPRLPLRTGQYQFTHRYAEQPTQVSIKLIATLSGRHITISNPVASPPFPAGVIASGELMWHAQSKQWIIVIEAEDRKAIEVGGCSDGPDVVDLVRRIYWTC
ncbi:MAG: hypothetical protein C0487_19275 [Leptothrix sp. (in: Bacteria)]|nr:hypothetical protein [Leptothrix sp. (in: b-proteobacteria)]